MPLNNSHLNIKQLRKLIDQDASLDIFVWDEDGQAYVNGNAMTERSLLGRSVSTIRCSSLPGDGEDKAVYQVYLKDAPEELTPFAGNVECDVLRVREEAGIAQKALAAKCGLSNRTVSDIERGDCLPSLEGALCIAEALGCGVDDLFRRKVKGPLSRHGKTLVSVGDRYGMLTVERACRNDLKSSSRARVWRCVCDCGRAREVRSDRLLSLEVCTCGNAECEEKMRKGN